MERFNDRSEEERHRLLPDSAFAALPRRPSLPPVAVPGDDEVAASREAAPILAMFRDFAAYVGTGRKLTQKGNLTLADARALVDLLGTGDLMERTIRDRTFRTTSSDNLYHLRQIFAWAKKAGVLRVVHGKVVSTKQGLGLADGLAGSFDRAVDALMAIGPLSSQRFPDNWFGWPEVDRVLDHLSAHLLIAPYGAQSAFPLEDIAATATGVVLDAFSFQMDDDRVAQRVAGDVSDIMDAFELAGVIRRIDTTDPGDIGRRSGGLVVLTPAGVVCVRRLLSEAGYETPTAGRFADASALELLLGTDGDDFPAVYGEVMAWRAARQPEQAAAEMADEGLADEGELFDPADVHGFVDILGRRMVTGGPDSLVATLALVGDHGHQVEVINQMWNAPSPVTDLVLMGISEVHSVKVVSKSARKALFKRRSSWQRQ